MVIVGASGDLTRRKLLPALHNLQMEDRVPDELAVVGVARTEYTNEEFQRAMRDAVQEHSRIGPRDDSWKRFFKDIYYVSGDATSDDVLDGLRRKLEDIDDHNGTRGNRLWYLATLPSLFPRIVEALWKNGLTETGGWQHLVVEKPFGNDLASARALNALLSQGFAEDQIFRIDHYLGKETVQNLLVLRFANAIFEPIWNRRYVDHVQITVAEDGGLGARGTFYEGTGALRDVGQNHLLQLLTLVGMEPPVAWDATAIRNEKVQVLRAVRRWEVEECEAVAARGQYVGYRDEPEVAPDSTVETYAALKLQIDNWRWADVPFYLRTGKNLASRRTDIVIRFQEVPHLLFKKTAVQSLDPNALAIRVQPNEGISLTFGAKVPGPEVQVRTVDMEFDYESDFGSGTPEAYERLLLDCMLGDATLFTRADEIEEAWEIVDPVLEHWARRGEPEPYDPGTWGPPSGAAVIEQDGRAWWGSTPH